MELRQLYLYGMIGKVEKNAMVVKCIPVFADSSNRYYKQTKTESGEVEYTPIELWRYGQPLFLPASKKKIGDGQEYFFIFQPTKSKQRMPWRVSADYGVHVGIYNNEEFCVLQMCTWPKLTEEEMTKLYRNFVRGEGIS